MGDVLVERAGEALEAQQGLVQAMRAWVDAGAMDPALDEELARCRRQRDQAALRLGLEVVRCLMAGEAVQLEWGEEEAAEAAPVKGVSAPSAPAGAAPAAVAAPSAPAPAVLAPSARAEAVPAVQRGASPAPPPDRRSLDALSQRMSQGSAPAPERRRFSDEERALIGADPHPGPAEEVRALQSLVARLDAWQPQVRQPELALAMHIAAARLRHLQAGRLPLTHEQGGQVAAQLRRLSAKAQEWRVAFIHGLAFDHRPRHGSWLSDARRYAAELRDEDIGPAARLAALREALEAGTLTAEEIPRRFQELVDAGVPSHDRALMELALPHLAVLQRSGCCKTLLRRLKELEREEEQAASGEDAGLRVEKDLRERTVGRRAVIVGGDERGTALQRIERAFGYASVEWERGWEVRRVQALAERIRTGSVDQVIMLRRFISHKLSDLLVPACKEKGVPMAWVPQGYGASQVERALRRALGLDAGSK